MTERELARRDGGGRLQLRPAPLRVRWELADLVSSDGHRLRCAFGCGVRAVDRPADRRMLEEALLDGRDAVTAEAVFAHFTPALRAAADRAIAARPGEGWLDAAAGRELGDVIKRAGDAVAFACGVELLAPVDVDLHSPTLERQRLETMERQLAERRAAGQVEHFQRAASLLREFEQLRQAAPTLSAGRLLERVNAADRGSMLEALLMASGERDAAARVYAVAGNHLVTIDPPGGASAMKTIELPADVGPFRSVRPDAVSDPPRRLLIGARTGFVLVHNGADAGAVYRDDATTSPLGFNAIVRWSDSAGYVGTHGEAGVVWWDVDGTASPRARFPIAGPRNLTRLDATTLAFSAGPELYVMGTETPPQPHALAGGGSAASIVGIEQSDRWLYVVREDGTVQVLDRITRELARSEKRCGRVTAVAALPWLGDVRLLLATDDGPVCCIGGDDPLVTQYVSPHRGLKAIAAGGGHVAGVTGDRQRIVLWHAWDGRKPAAEIHVGAATRHRVADVCFA